MKRSFIVALAASASLFAASSAQAASYVITGNFTGTLFGQPFANVPATFTGIGSAKPSGLGLDGTDVFALTSLSALANGVTYTFTDKNLKFFTNGTVSGYRINALNTLFGFDSTTGVATSTSATANGGQGYAVSAANGATGFVTIASGTGLASPVPAAPGAVPEPATWAMMMLGFGMIGFGLRSRRKQQVRVTYA